MNRLKKINDFRLKLDTNGSSVGSWMQIPNSSIAEIMGDAGYDWVAVDLEHGSIGVGHLPDLFRALELGGTLPLVRLAEGKAKDCKDALDAGAAGVIVPMVENAKQLVDVRNACAWPPIGMRGVGFSRANLFGKYFKEYKEESQVPILVAMIENISAIDELDEICKVDGLDAIFIGPYDLSASIGMIGQFDSNEFIEIINQIKKIANNNNIPFGIHVVTPSINELKNKLKEGYRFIAYSIDALMLSEMSNQIEAGKLNETL